MAAQRSQPRRVASPRPTLRARVPRTRSRTADAQRRQHAGNPVPALHLHPAQLPEPQQAFAQQQQHITTRTATTPHISSHAHTHLSAHRPSPTRARTEHTPAHTPLHSNHQSMPHSTHTSTRTRPHIHTHARARAFLAAAASARASPRSRLSRLPQTEAKNWVLSSTSSNSSLFTALETHALRDFHLLRRDQAALLRGSAANGTPPRRSPPLPLAPISARVPVSAHVHVPRMLMVPAVAAVACASWHGVRSCCAEIPPLAERRPRAHQAARL